MVSKLKDLVAYQVAIEIGDDIYNLVVQWSFFDKDTLGKQIVRSADSIALNIAEGYGRFHFKENKNFCFYSRGSQFETSAALLKAKNRNLIDQQTFNNINQKLERFHKLINGYIKSIGNISIVDPKDDLKQDL
ncbi:MAG: four helix bundle protein [Chitinophagaceae bacterium]|nr:four helix bundle protein [Chitinophagaceae bacterium]